MAIVVLLSFSLTGCLGDDIWREPFLWRDHGEYGENLEGAQAFASALTGLAEQAQATGQDQVVGTAQELPDTVFFQNLKEFMETQAPGSGEQFEEGVRTVTDGAGEAYATLTGPMADAYDQVVAPLGFDGGPITIPVAERATRVHLIVDVVLDLQPQEPGQNPTPANRIEIVLTDPKGAERAHYLFDTTRALEDEVITGTFGDRNEVREHLGGDWTLQVWARGMGAWSVQAEAYEPEYEDYEFWQFWRGDLREVVN